MFNVRNSVYIVAGALILSACGKDISREEKDAESLYESAEKALNDGCPKEAIILLDSLDRNYRGVTEVMRRSMTLRPEAIEADCAAEINALDSLSAALNSRLDSIAQLMRHVDVPSTDGYFLPKNFRDQAFLATNGVSPRVDGIGQMYVVASINPMGKISLMSMTFKGNGLTLSTETATSEGEAIFRTGGSGVVTFSPSLCDSLPEFFSEMPADTSVKVTFNSDRGRIATVNIKSDDYSTAARYSLLIKELRNCSIERERLESRLALAREQKYRMNSSKEKK